MKISETIGINDSKKTIDTVIYSNSKHRQFKNNKEGFKEMIVWVSKNSGYAFDDIFFAFEQTGIYSLPLTIYLTEEKIPFTHIPDLELKKSLGIARGKDDKVDAKAIAEQEINLS